MKARKPGLTTLSQGATALVKAHPSAPPRGQSGLSRLSPRLQTHATEEAA
jgi:hypothetical protein